MDTNDILKFFNSFKDIIIKYFPYILLVLFFLSATILFSPDHFLSKLFLINIRDNYGMHIGLCFLFSSIILLIILFYKFYNKVKKQFNLKIFYKNGYKTLKSLSPSQKHIVNNLYKTYNHTANLPIYDGDVVLLNQNRIIARLNENVFVDYFELNNPPMTYMLHPWVVTTLDKHSDLRQLFESEAIQSNN